MLRMNTLPGARTTKTYAALVWLCAVVLAAFCATARARVRARLCNPGHRHALSALRHERERVGAAPTLPGGVPARHGFGLRHVHRVKAHARSQEHGRRLQHHLRDVQTYSCSRAAC